MSPQSRDRKIAADVARDQETFTALAGKYGLSYQRIKEIAREQGVDTKGRRQRITAKKKEALYHKHRKHIEQEYRKTPRCDKVATKLNLPVSLVYSVVKDSIPEHLRRAKSSQKMETSPYTREDIIKALRRASKAYGQYPYLRENWYKIISKANPGEYPISLTVRNWFPEGWDTARKAAGLKNLPHGRTKEEKLAVLLEVSNYLGKIPTLREYEDLQSERPDLPSVGVFKNKGKSWLDWIKELEDLTQL